MTSHPYPIPPMIGSSSSLPISPSLVNHSKGKATELVAGCSGGGHSLTRKISLLRRVLAAASRSSSRKLIARAMSTEKQWFSETEAMWPGQKFSLEVEEVLFRGKSDFQDVLVFKSATYGHVLVLDGVIQLTERDEFAYQEMITHLPMFAHKQPKRVLIVGGGDGGVLREVTKHACVEQVVMCEIDSMVCDVSKRFFKDTVATAFDDPRVTLLHADAAVYLRENTTEKFDVVIVDSSDPVGPAEVLYRAEFYENMKNSLSPDGVICTQGECLWLHLDLIVDVMQRCQGLFPTVNYSYTTIPTYPSGQIGFIMCSLDQSEGVLAKPKRTPDAEMQESLRYYSAQIHEAAFVLPSFAERKIAAVRK